MPGEEADQLAHQLEHRAWITPHVAQDDAARARAGTMNAARKGYSELEASLNCRYRDVPGRRELEQIVRRASR